MDFEFDECGVILGIDLLKVPRNGFDDDDDGGDDGEDEKNLDEFKVVGYTD